MKAASAPALAEVIGEVPVSNKAKAAAEAEPGGADAARLTRTCFKPDLRL